MFILVSKKCQRWSRRHLVHGLHTNELRNAEGRKSLRIASMFYCRPRNPTLGRLSEFMHVHDGRCKVVESQNAQTLRQKDNDIVLCISKRGQSSAFPREYYTVLDCTVKLSCSADHSITAASHVKRDCRACEEITIAIQGQRKALGTKASGTDRLKTVVPQIVP